LPIQHPTSKGVAGRFRGVYWWSSPLEFISTSETHIGTEPTVEKEMTVVRCWSVLAVMSCSKWLKNLAHKKTTAISRGFRRVI